jgi:hypothetical protein
MHGPWRSIIALVLVASLGATAAGCFNPFRPLVSGQTVVVSPAPAPTSARDLIMLFKWCWENRDIARYKTLFTDDYRFAFAITDSAGNGYRTNPWIRTDEIISATNLFVGGSATEPAASSITLIFDGDPQVEADGRDGMNPKWHQQVFLPSLTLTINKTDGSATRVTGGALFYVTRGDSAVIPPELGLGPDSTRWYINRWEDQTNTGSGAAAAGPAPRAALRPAALAAAGFAATRAGIASLPATGAAAAPSPFPVQMSWGEVKALWRNP